MLSVRQGGIKYHFLSIWYDGLGLNPGLYPLGQCIYTNIYGELSQKFMISNANYLG